MKKIVCSLMAVVLCLSFAACGVSLDLSADLEPKDFESIVYVPTDDALAALALTPEDFEDDIYDNGMHRSDLTVTVCGQEFEFWLQTWDGIAQDYWFYYRQPLDDTGLELYFDYAEKLEQLYGEPVDPSTYGVIDLGKGLEHEVTKWYFDDWQIILEGETDSTYEEPYMRMDLYIRPNFEVVRDGLDIHAVPKT